ncbi:Sugar (pentulose or hexulose) kinase [Dethiosulfatibacter aminovorans DSM 17477]|uniref:Sugar (Pentulose or hexulose) kinase n=1 Tax=Dethiosulfatibacter aminovorans DSM 17477 TaxID=1121476 RepID=A0A1M6IY78_9FIRM|nr:FGGY-family carbohydrate kinase [Dethiosulfatibacter aminovorans]SHJ39370.1 Sugar (pentulose or hexulose) kinase [Dethiosulfatibacter aminovorans DSM 17477]
MENKYIIGVDEGSQSAKVIIFDLEGNVVCEGRQPLRPMDLPEPGIVEHPDDDFWDAIISAGNKAMDKFPGKKEEIIGMGLCTIRFCRCFLKEDGSLAQPALSWMDERVSKAYEHVNDDVKYVTTSSGYITHRFTGNFNDTAANYQGMWPIDTDTWEWTDDEEYFKSINIPREMLFNLQMPGTILGYITEEAANATGFPAGIPVIATGNDKAVEALGSGTLSEKTALVSLGTYICSMVHGHDNPKGTEKFWTNFANTPNNYLYESFGIRRGMWTVSWFKNLLGDDIVNKANDLGISPEEYLNREAEDVPAGSHGLMTVLDWLAPSHEPYKKGIMIGFDGRHTRAHMYRSILEGIAMTIKNCADDMCEELGIELKDIVVSGGGSNSELFMQIFADVFGLPARRNVVNGSASLGAAISVAVALDEYDSYENAIEKMVKIRDVFEPLSDNVGTYKSMNDGVYKHITSCTDEILKKSFPVFK